MPAKFSKIEASSRRAEILAAAAEVFAAKGYEGATVRDLEAATGLTRGGIFFHFPGKRRLYLAMLRRVLLLEPLSDRGKLMDERMRGATSAEEALLVAFGGILEWHGEHPAAMHLFEQIAVQRDDAEIAELDREIAHSLDGWVTQLAQILQERGVFNPDLDPEVAAGLIRGVMDHLTAAAQTMSRGRRRRWPAASSG